MVHLEKIWKYSIPSLTFILLVSCDSAPLEKLVTLKVGYDKYIKWSGDDYIETLSKSGWTPLSLCRIKNASKIKAQGNSGSCAINSSGRAFELVGIPFEKEYDEFLSASELYSSANIKRKIKLEKKVKNGSKYFDQITTLQNEYYKNNIIVRNNLYKQSFVNGSNYTNISKFITEKYSYIVNVEMKVHTNFDDCVRDITLNVLGQNATVGSFKSTKDSFHSMNIIGYYQQYAKIECFALLNTWGGCFTYGEISYDECKLCMDKPKYHLLKFTKN